MDFIEFRLSERGRLLFQSGVRYLWSAHKPLGPETEHNASWLHNIPEHLQPLFHGKHEPVRVLWTYVGLDQDLQGTGLQERWDLVQKIQDSVHKFLKWPAQDLVLWPLDPALSIARGAAHLRPQYILCFGQSWTVLKNQWPPLVPQPDLLALPGLKDMVAGDQGAKNRAWKILQDLKIK